MAVEQETENRVKARATSVAASQPAVGTGCPWTACRRQVDHDGWYARMGEVRGIPYTARANLFFPSYTAGIIIVGSKKMKGPKEKRARDIMKRIHDVLWNDWDPIGVKGYGPDDEYDSYIGGIHRIFSGNPTESELIDHLYRIETGRIGLSSHDKELLRPIAQKLMGIDVASKEA